MNKEIEAEEWREYFMELLGEIEYRVLGGDGERERSRRKKWTRRK